MGQPTLPQSPEKALDSVPGDQRGNGCHMPGTGGQVLTWEQRRGAGQA